MADRRRRRVLIGWVLAGIIWLAFALRVTGLDFQSLWRDEVDAIRFATGSLSDLLHTFSEPGQNGPLYFLFLRLWLGATGRSEFALRFFSTFSGVLAVPLVYRLGRRLFPPWPAVALLGALLAATSPYLVWYSQEGKMYALVTVLVSLSMERYLSALEEGGWQRWLVYVAATMLSFYVHLIAVLIIPAQALVFLIVGRQTRYRHWKPWLVSMMALTVPYIPMLVWQLPLLLEPFLLEPVQTGYRFVPLHEIFFSLLTSYSLGVLQGTTLWSLAPFVALLLASGLLLVGSRRWRVSLMVLACWSLIPVIAFFLVTLIRPLYTARYLIFVLPAYLLLMAFAVAAIGRRSKLVSVLLLVVLLALNGWGIWLQARTPLKADFRAATRHVSRQLGPQDLVIFQIPHGRYSFDYYFQPPLPQFSLPGLEAGYRILLPWQGGGGGQPYRWADGLYTNAGMTPGDVARQMEEITAGSRVVWLIATEISMWDERNLVQGWLDGHAVLIEKVEFVRVTVYRYALLR